MFLDLIKMVITQVKKRKLRTFLTMIQVMMGIATIALIFNIIFGLWAGLDDMEHDNNIYQFQIGTQQDRNGRSSTSITGHFTVDDINNIRQEVDTIVNISPLESTFEPLVEYNNEYFRVRRKAEVGADFINMVDISVIEGSFFTEEDFRQQSPVIVVSKSVANRIFSDNNVIGKKIEIYPYWQRDRGREESQTFTVIGVFEIKGDNTGFEYSQFYGNQLLSPATVKNSGGRTTHFEGGTVEGSSFVVREQTGDSKNVEINTTFSRLMIEIEEGQYASTETALSAFADDISNGRGDALLNQQGVRVQGMEQTVTIISIVMSIFGLLIIVIGSIGILSTMMVNILERTRQIGIEKALGASRRLIFFKFNIESIIIALGGGFLGLIVAYFLADHVMGILDTFPVNLHEGLHPMAILVAILVSIFAGWIFGIYPSFQASRLAATDALRDNN